MRFGIDFGTTNSAIAYFDGEKLHSIKVDDKNVNPNILPSLIYFKKGDGITVGADAATVYLGNESGRIVRWKSKVIGEVQITVAGKGGSPIQYWQSLSILIDDAATGRLFQSVKTYLRNMAIEGTQVFDRYFTIDQIMSLLLKDLKQRAEDQFKQPCEDVVLGRPVTYSYDPDIDARAEEILYKAAHLAGFKKIGFALEPIGAAFLYHNNEPTRRKILIFDFGGGTLDLTVAEVGGNEHPVILATRGVLIGGDDLDRTIMQMLYKYFAADEKKNEVTISDDMASQLQTWQTMPEISKPHFQEQIRGLLNRAQQTKDRDTVVRLEALNTLVNNALGYSLFRQIEDAKKRLSDDISASLIFEHGNLRINETIQRNTFSNRLRKEAASVKEAVEQVVIEAGFVASDIDYVVRTGGTSQVPMFVDMLADMFGEEKLRAIDPLASVVGGLAIMAAENEGRIPFYSTKYVSDPSSLVYDISTVTGSKYETFTIQAGEKCYIDVETTKIDKLSIQLSALPAIRTAAADLHNEEEILLRFTISSPSKVYVAYSDNADSIPNWLKKFSKSGYVVEIRDAFDRVTRMPVYVKEFEVGEVTLGGNKASGIEGVYNNYIVIVEKII